MIKNLNEVFLTDDEAKTCKLDGKSFNSSKKMIWYVRKTYKLNFENYILKTYYNDVRPVCLKTGNSLSFKSSKLGPFFHNYSKNNFPRKSHTAETKEKIKKTMVDRFGVKKIVGINKFNPINVDELLEKLNTSSYTSDYKLLYDRKIVDKQHLNGFIYNNGKKSLEEHSPVFLKFIRMFQPTLPYPDLEENLLGVIYKISKYDLSKVYNSVTNEFSNNTSTIGHNYLKHHFHSYWKSKFNGNPSPTEAWLDDKLMNDVIKYRIGCNNSGEVFDFSLKQLVRGLSARRINVSFFKPVLAASIYKHYIGDKLNPIVLDPCCGFGGRLLGFKSIYPNGIYIGCEPNVETYNELLKLKTHANWDNVEIYNCEFENFKINGLYDLIFTSIPYYDLEIYSNNIEYKSFKDWKTTFIKSINYYSGKNCYINTTQELSIKLDWKNIDSYIVSSPSHFGNKSKLKREVIVRV